MEDNQKSKPQCMLKRDQSLFTMKTQQRHCMWRISPCGEFFTDPLSIDILYYPEERDNKGELIKAGHHVLLRRAILLSQPENEKVYSLGDHVAVRSETNDWFMCMMSEIKGSKS